MFLKAYYFVMLSYYPAWALFGLVLTHTAHWIRVCIYAICGVFLWRGAAALRSGVARGFGSVSQISLNFL